MFSHGMWLIWVLLPLVSACGRTVSPRKLSKWLPCNEVWLPTAAELSGGQTKRRMVAAALSSRSMQTSFFLCPSALLGPLLDTDRTLVKGHSYKILFDQQLSLIPNKPDACRLRMDFKTTSNAYDPTRYYPGIEDLARWARASRDRKWPCEIINGLARAPMALRDQRWPCEIDDGLTRLY